MSREKRTPEQRASTVREYWLELCHSTVSETAAKARAAMEKWYDYTGNSDARSDSLLERGEAATERAENERRRIAAAFDGHAEDDDAPPIMPTEKDARRLAQYYADHRVTCAVGTPRTAAKLGRLFARLIRDAERWERGGREPDIIADTRGEPRDATGCMAGCLRKLGRALLWAVVILAVIIAMAVYFGQS